MNKKRSKWLAKAEAVQETRDMRIQILRQAIRKNQDANVVFRKAVEAAEERCVKEIAALGPEPMKGHNDE